MSKTKAPSKAATFVQTFEPTPSSITLQPTPTSFLDTTQSPTPTTLRATTLQPTPTTFIPFVSSPTFEPTFEPTASPTSSFDFQAGLPIGSIITIIFALIVLCCCWFCIWWNCFREKKKDPDEEALLSPPAQGQPAPPHAAVANKVLSKGIFLYTATGKKNITLKIVDSSLRWRTPAGKGYSVDMKDVTDLTSGKVTLNFESPVCAEAQADRCMSLILAKTTVDLELETTRARDLLLSNLYHMKIALDNPPPPPAEEPKSAPIPETISPLHSPQLSGEGEGLGAVSSGLPSQPLAAAPLAAPLAPATPAPEPVTVRAPSPVAAVPPDEAAATINKALAAGPVQLHASRGPAEVLMSLVGTELRWSSVLTKKKYRIEFQTILFIENGKKNGQFAIPSIESSP